MYAHAFEILFCHHHITAKASPDLLLHYVFAMTIGVRTNDPMSLGGYAI